MRNEISNRKNGFTLIELLIVVGIIALLASIIITTLREPKEKGRAAAASQTASALKYAVEFYFSDMGFFPPDVGRGWDPGFSQALPFNADTGATTTPACPHCPPNWTALVTANWNGPYINEWPDNTPWGGEYDYNHWPVGATRYGCTVPPGIYIGVQGDYSNENTITTEGEAYLISKGIEAEQCENGESQLLLYAL